MAIPLKGARRAACDWGGSSAPRWSVRLSHPLLLLAVLLSALWPMWHWYARRMIDGSEMVVLDDPSLAARPTAEGVNQ